MDTNLKERFPLGRLVITTNASIDLDMLSIQSAIGRHASGDWGDVCPADWDANNMAAKIGERIHSAYQDSKGTKFWIITEADRRCTTVLLPTDY